MDSPNVERLIEQWLLRIRIEGSRVLDELCDRFPERAPELRKSLERPAPQVVEPKSIRPDRVDDYACAIAAFEGYRRRRRQGEAESPADFLTQHPGLRDILEPLVQHATASGAGTEDDVPSVDPGTADPALALGAPSTDGTFAHYRLMRRLGAGGMGEVYLAEDLRLGRRVALKLIRRERKHSDEVRRRFDREARVVAGLEHPTICPVFEVGECDGVPFMAMRYLAGCSLAEAIDQARLVSEGRAVGDCQAGALRAFVDALASADRSSKTVVLAVIEKVARALHFAHEHGVIHRDVKPSNIMITDEGEPMVLDFGLARHEVEEESLTLTEGQPGTPAYMSPEQIAPRGRALDRTTDVYSLGATLYECVTQLRMVGAASLPDLFAAVVAGRHRPASQVQPSLSVDLDVVVETAVAVERERRYATALALADDLRRVRLGEPIAARPLGRVARAWRWTRRHPLPAAFIAFAAAALLAIGYLMGAGWVAQRKLDLVAVVRRVDTLRNDEATLYDAWPHHADTLRSWLVRAQGLIDELPTLRTRTVSLSGAEAVEVARVIREVEALAREGSVVEQTRAELEWAERQLDAAMNADREDWANAIAAIRAHPCYGFELTPQPGLVPLGESPQSRLWEFAHPRSGTVPERDEHGAFRITGESCLVFVLLPGGLARIGSQTDRDKPNYDSEAGTDEQPVVEVTLDPYFLSKYEMSQGQWVRLAGPNPSHYQPGEHWGDHEITLAHPVERVSWIDCTSILRPLGLELPTEAQWEFACRAGTDTPWYTGRDRESLLGRVNLADQAAVRAAASNPIGFVWARWADWPELDDGHAVHARVDAFPPNPWGLFQITGNVLEWCRDGWKRLDSPCETGTGLRAGPPNGTHPYRGGAFDKNTVWARSSYRTGTSAAFRNHNIGFRPARRVRSK
ncbi:MAG: SUMF1/EgtB/PvdO family nonheme iron enzyme [Planctomycetota bacterium]